MKLIFAGTPEFAAVALRALIGAGHDIALVLSQPDRPAGRGMKPRVSPVKAVAVAHDLPVYQPERLKEPASHEPIRAAAGELMVVAAYGLLLPQAVLDIPPLGCINIHASLLPRWRGAAPIHRAILAGDASTGITLMRMDAGLDTGAMLAKAEIPILPEDSTGSLHDRLAELGGRELVALLPRLGEVRAVPQDAALATYAAKIAKDEATLDWGRPAAELQRQVRAFDPFPGASTESAGAPIKIWRASLAEGRGQPGEILSADAGGLLVACGEGALRVLELQKAGGRRLGAAAFLSGHALAAGARLGGA